MGACQPQNHPDYPPNNISATPSSVASHARPSRSNPFFDSDTGTVNGQNILDDYNFHSYYNDKFIGQCSVLEEKQSGNLYLSKEKVFDNDRDYEEYLQSLKKKKVQLTHENVLKVREAFGKTTDGFFKQKKKVIAIIDYPFISLHREIADRNFKKIPFNYDQVRNIIVSTIKGYKSIQSAGYPVDRVRLRYIFIGIENKKTKIKVSEGGFIAKSNNYGKILSSGFNDPANKDIYLSPEEFDAWKKQVKNYHPSKKQGVFSLGMSLLDICVMMPSIQIYHVTEKVIDEVEIRNRVQIAGKKYGGFVEKLLTEMLKIDKQKRPSFRELQDQLSLLRVNEQLKMQLSVIPAQQTGFIDNDNKNLHSMLRSVVEPPSSERNHLNSKLRSERKTEDIEKITEEYTNGNKYIGQKKGGMKHGKGRYEFKDGSYYNGQWDNNRICGRGQLYFPNHKLQYEGEWYNDEFNGWGIHYSEEGEVWQRYEGEFQNGVKEGRGKMYFRDGTIYEGEFRAGKISGKGRKVTKNGEVIEKHWETISPAFFLPDRR